MLLVRNGKSLTTAPLLHKLFAFGCHDSLEMSPCELNENVPMGAVLVAAEPRHGEIVDEQERTDAFDGFKES